MGVSFVNGLTSHELVNLLGVGEEELTLGVTQEILEDLQDLVEVQATGTAAYPASDTARTKFSQYEVLTSCIFLFKEV